MGFNDGFDRFGQGQGNFPGSQQGSSNLPLQMLQHQVEQQPQVIPPHVNGSSPIKFMHDGPGFDPFQREPEKRDEISYDWVSFLVLILFDN